MARDEIERRMNDAYDVWRERRKAAGEFRMCSSATAFVGGYLAGLARARDHLASAAAHVQSLEEHGLSTHSASANLAYEMQLLTEEIASLSPAPPRPETKRGESHAD